VSRYMRRDAADGRALDEQWAEAIEDDSYFEAYREHCKLGICDHYTCTNGRNLEEFERNNPDLMWG